LDFLDFLDSFDFFNFLDFLDFSIFPDDFSIQYVVGCSRLKWKAWCRFWLFFCGKPKAIEMSSWDWLQKKPKANQLGTKSGNCHWKIPERWAQNMINQKSQ
jgi:hypothetical protein